MLSCFQEEINVIAWIKLSPHLSYLVFSSVFVHTFFYISKPQRNWWEIEHLHPLAHESVWHHNSLTMSSWTRIGIILVILIRWMLAKRLSPEQNWTRTVLPWGQWTAGGNSFYIINPIFDKHLCINSPFWWHLAHYLISLGGWRYVGIHALSGHFGRWSFFCLTAK